MRTREMGRTGKQVPVVGQGTWQMEFDDRDECIAALHAGLEAGATHLDTAEMYGDGLVEEMVGEVIAGRRDEVYLVSKVLPNHATFDGTLKACERSLRRLQTDRLDQYLLHWPGSIPLEETIRAFEALLKDGKILAWGLSNFDLDQLVEAAALEGPGRIACDQVLYNLEERTAEARVLPWCREHGPSLVAYSPFGSGRFPSPRSAGGRALAEVGKHHRATPFQVALARLLDHEQTFVIPKSSSVEHARQNAAAADLQLTPGELALIDEAFPLRHRHELPML